MATYLTLIIDKATGKEVAEYLHDAADDYWAKRKAAAAFEEQQRYVPRLRKVTDWYADAVAL